MCAGGRRAQNAARHGRARGGVVHGRRVLRSANSTICARSKLRSRETRRRPFSCENGRPQLSLSLSLSARDACDLSGSLPKWVSGVFFANAKEWVERRKLASGHARGDATAFSRGLDAFHRICSPERALIPLVSAAMSSLFPDVCSLPCRAAVSTTRR